MRYSSIVHQSIHLTWILHLQRPGRKNLVQDMKNILFPKHLQHKVLWPDSCTRQSWLQTEDVKSNRYSTNLKEITQTLKLATITDLLIISPLLIERRRANRGFPTRMVYLHYISCLRYTILVRNPWNAEIVHICHTYRTSLWSFPFRNQPLQKFELLHTTLQWYDHTSSSCLITRDAYRYEKSYWYYRDIFVLYRYFYSIYRHLQKLPPSDQF